jgi:biuret amidohydrolase
LAAGFDIILSMESSDRQFEPSSTALVVVDMQGDYCSAGYYMDQAGYDIARLRKPIVPLQQVLSAARQSGLTIMFTRQYRLPEGNEEVAVNSYPPIALKGVPGWEIIPELSSQEDETVLDKTTCSAFASTDIDKLLKGRDIHTLVLCGNTIDVCVHSTLRSANDLGYSCITLSDCCGAVNDELHHWSLESIKVEDGVFGDVMESRQFIAMLEDGTPIYQ